jgi:ADP-ribose pyrophosphatase YjhB (NUDIX family)
MAHVTEALWAPVEVLLGRPTVHHWTFPISEPEMQMVVSSTRGQTRLHDVTAFLFNERGEIALIRKASYPPGAWRAPGGGLHPGETFLEGASREALEETGMMAAFTRYLLRIHATFTWENQIQPWTTHVLIGRAAGGLLQTGDPREIAGTCWGSLEQLCGPAAEAMLATGRGLFAYRVALHREVARLLAEGSTVER